MHLFEARAIEKILDTYREQGFSENQINEIKLGMESGIDFEKYADKSLFYLQMEEIRKGLDENIDLSVYVSSDFDWLQMHEIYRGLKEQLDVSIYAKKKYDYMVMREIRHGLVKGYDISGYIVTGCEFNHLRHIRRLLEQGVDVDKYLKLGYDGSQIAEISIAEKDNIDIMPYISNKFRDIQIEQIRKGVEVGIDVKKYDDCTYTWQQMREIRYGLANRIDVGLYLKKNYTFQQMRQIRKGLEEGLDVSSYTNMFYSAIQMEKMRLAIIKKNEESRLLAEKMAKILLDKQNIVESILTDEEPEEKEENCTSEISIRILAEEMKASLEIKCSDMRKTFKADDIIRELNNKGIIKGIKRDKIEKMIVEKIYNKEMVVAKGRRHSDGEDGYYEYLVKIDESLKKPKILEDGSVDYKSVTMFAKVSKGQVVARYHKATQGVMGYTITGKVIMQARGKEQPLLRGTGFSLSEDKTEYISNLNGRIDYSDNKISIISVYEVMDSVKLSNGNVKFDGEVIIHGSVMNGVIIEASGDVIIDGFVESARIISGRDVLLKSGMAASGDGLVSAKGEVKGKFFEAVRIIAKDDIMSNYMMNCDVTTTGKVIVTGERGMIVGGQINAMKGIEVSTLGNKAGMKTIVEVGTGEDLRIKYAHNEEEIKLNKKAIEEMYAYRRKTNLIKGEKSESQKEMDEKITLTIQQREEELEEYNAIKEELDEKLKWIKKAAVKVNKEAYPGVFIKMDKAKYVVPSKMANVSFRKNGNKIAIYRL